MIHNLSNALMVTVYIGLFIGYAKSCAVDSEFDYFDFATLCAFSMPVFIGLTNLIGGV